MYTAEDIKIAMVLYSAAGLAVGIIVGMALQDFQTKTGSWCGAIKMLFTR